MQLSIGELDTLLRWCASVAVSEEGLSTEDEELRDKIRMAHIMIRLGKLDA